MSNISNNFIKKQVELTREACLIIDIVKSPLFPKEMRIFVSEAIIEKANREGIRKKEKNSIIISL